MWRKAKKQVWKALCQFIKIFTQIIYGLVFRILLDLQLFHISSSKYDMQDKHYCAYFLSNLRKICKASRILLDLHLFDIFSSSSKYDMQDKHYSAYFLSNLRKSCKASRILLDLQLFHISSSISTILLVSYI